MVLEVATHSEDPICHKKIREPDDPQRNAQYR